ncbi:MAG TPA: hypothetical protein VFX79_00065 [Candidatus Saccharimonadales bacterium]|nr:hypothetical protein [Candidatus Saccharimonadales bacterium]
MKIQTSGEQMQIKTGGITQLVMGIIFSLVGIFIVVLPFLGAEDSNGNKMPMWLGLVGLVFFAIGVFLFLSAKSKMIKLVKNGQSNITTKKLLGGGTHTQDFQTSAIVAVNLSTRNEYVNTGTSTNNSRSTMQRRSDLHLILNDNSTIEITSSSGQSGFSLNGINMTSLVRKAPLSKEAEQIAGFLGVPVKYEDSSSLQGLKDMIMGKDASQPAATTPPLNPNVPTQTPQDAETVPPQNKPEQQ